MFTSTPGQHFEIIAMKIVIDFIFRPKPSYPDSWKPAFVAMQLGFLAGALGLILRDLFIIYTIENWNVIVLTELAFGAIVGLGFLLHTIGRAALGVVIACLGGVGSATAFLVLLNRRVKDTGHCKMQCATAQLIEHIERIRMS